jgi:peptide deformylase
MATGTAKLPPSRLSIVTGSRRTLDLPEHVLRQGAREVDYDAVSAAERWALARGLLRALHAGPVGSGLAAPMTGVGLRVVVSTAGEHPLVMVNPRIVATHGRESTGEEGNLCLPEVRAPVSRPDGVTVEWQSVGSGQVLTERFDGWAARVLQHEIEILDGRLFIDHAAAPPLGSWLSAEERARRAADTVFGEATAGPGRTDALGLVTLPVELRELDVMLTRPSAPLDIGAFEPSHLRAVVQAMLRVMYEQRGVGLAAPQVGLGLRLAVIDAGVGEPEALINPRIVDCDEREDLADEGCLSLPGWRGPVSRSTAIKVATDAITGETVERSYSGQQARVVQHELDHLDGVLFTRRMRPGAELYSVDADVVADDLTRAVERQEAPAKRPSRPKAKRRR